jgi:hypothetical protein
MRFSILPFLVIFSMPGFPQSLDTSAVTPQIPTGAIIASVQVDRKEVPQNFTVKFILKISWQGDLQRYEIKKVDQPVLTNLEMVGSSASNWVGEVAGVKQAIKTYEFILKPVSLGMAYIDGMIVDYHDKMYDEPHSLVTNRLEVKVIEPLAEKSNRVLVLTVSGILFLIIVSGGTMMLIKRKREREAELRNKVITIAPPEDKYLEELSQGVDLKSHNAGEAFSALSKILRRYLSERYHIPALEVTTHEITSELSKLAVSEKIIEQVQEALQSCDVAKFSGGQAESGALDRAYTLVEDILNRNKREFIESTN